MKPISGVIGIRYDPTSLKEIKSLLPAHGEDKTPVVKPSLYLHLTVLNIEGLF